MAKKNFDIREIVTRKIIEGLEKGVLPWQKPWKGGGAVNHVTNKSYRGLNQLTLSFASIDEGWVNRWVTMKVIRKNSWRIIKGESPQYIAFFKWVDEKDDNGEKTGDKFPLLRYYKVWSISQLEEADEIEIPKPENEFEPIEKAEQIVKNMPNAPHIQYGGNRAVYTPSKDRVITPIPEAFDPPDEFYSALFHELAHSTGHKKRLNREIENGFGDEKYSLEELIAEFASAFLCAEAGIDNTIENSTAYIQGWLKKLKNDRQMVLTAASKAQKASDYILGITWD